MGPGRWMWPGMMPTLAWPGEMMPGQLGPMRRQSESFSAAITRTMSRVGMPSVMHTATLTPAGGGLQNGVGGKGRGHENQGSVGPRLGHRLGHGVEHRDLVHLLAAFARGHPRHHLGAVFGAGPGMERAFLAGNPLHHHPRIVIYQNAHTVSFLKILLLTNIKYS